MGNQVITALSVFGVLGSLYMLRRTDNGVWAVVFGLCVGILGLVYLPL